MRINSLVERMFASYPRARIEKGSESEAAYCKVVDCIMAAKRRGPVTKTLAIESTIPRYAILQKHVALLSIADQADPFLGVYEGEMTAQSGTFDNRMVRGFSFTAWPFTDAERDEMSRSIPKIDFLFGDTKVFVKYGGQPLGQEVWEEGMDYYDELAYKIIVHPAIIREIGNLKLLSPDALVCEPACHNGNLLAELHAYFPGFSVVGSDISWITWRPSQLIFLLCPAWLMKLF